jgi:ketosteroid isomerase-like protein
MRRASLTALLALLAALLAGVPVATSEKHPRTGAGATPAGDVAAVLRRQTQELMDAVAPGDSEVWRRYLHDDAVYLDENGVVYDKESLLRELTPLPSGLVGRIEVDRFEMKLHGDTAVVAAELQEYLDYHGQDLRTRFRFMDTWLRTSDGWRLAARHTAAVLKDPPAISLAAEELCAYAGEYRLTPAITTTVRCTDKGLTAERTGRPLATYLPEVRDVFFVVGQPRSRRIFLRDAAGKVVAFADRREGEDVRWQKSLEQAPPGEG